MTLEPAKSDRKHPNEPGVFIPKHRAEEIARRSLKQSGGVIRVFDFDQLTGIIYRALLEGFREGSKRKTS